MRPLGRRVGMEPDPGGDAALRGTPEVRAPRRVRWSLILVWFMRLTALLWIAKGLSFWAVIVGAGYGLPSFETRSIGFQASVVYFGIIDLVAAVGLWLVSTWGGVMWLLAAMSHLILAFFFPGVVPGSMSIAATYVGLIFTYLVLSWLAAGEEE